MHLTRNIFGIHHPVHKATLFLTHLGLITLSFSLASKLRLDALPEYLAIEFIGLTLIILISMFFGGVFTSKQIGRRPKLPMNTFFVVLSSIIPSLAFIYLLGPENFTAILGRGVYPIAISGYAVLAVSNQYLWNRIYYHPATTRWTVIVGTEESQKKLESTIKSRDIELRVKGIASITQLKLSKSEMSSIVLSPEYTPSSSEQKTLLDLRLEGLPIFSYSDFLENFFFFVPVHEIDNNWFIRAQGFSMLGSSTALRVKRFIDVIFAILLIVLSIPILLLASMMIALTSRGTILFKQNRVGINGSEFTLYKLRTMEMNAEKKGAEWAKDNDSRVFPVGKLLRKTRIDELPQCWNILRGEMSLVGPRPERPEFTHELSKDIPYYDLRHVVKPGLTGWAQVSYPYGSSAEDALKKLQFDLYYIKNYTLVLDLNIMLRTVLVMLRRSGR